MTQRNVSFAMMALGAVLFVLGLVGVGSGGGDQTAGPAASSDASSGLAAETPPRETTETPSPATTLPTDIAAQSTTDPTATSSPPPIVAPDTTLPPPTTVPMPSETPEEFLALLVLGLKSDADFLVSRLNQATLDLYGAEQCLQTFAQILDPKAALQMREVGPTGPWDWVIDDITTPLDDVLAVEVQRLAGGQTLIQELHWKLVNGQWTWFSDCGDPLDG